MNEEKDEMLYLIKDIQARLMLIMAHLNIQNVVIDPDLCWYQNSLEDAKKSLAKTKSRDLSEI